MVRAALLLATEPLDKITARVTYNSRYRDTIGGITEGLMARRRQPHVLSHFKVLDLTEYLSGPMLTRIWPRWAPR